MPTLRAIVRGFCFAFALIAAAPEAGATELAGGDDGLSHRLDPDTTLRLSPGARARVLPRTKVELGSGGPVPAFAIALERGAIEVSTSAPKTRSAVLVRAPGRVACVAAAARAIVTVDRGTTAVAAPDAEIVVAQGDDWRPLAKGQLRAFGPNDAGGTKPILAPPSPKLSRQVTLSGASGTRVEWPAVEGALRYRVRVGASGSFEVTETKLALGELPAGRHEISVNAIDRHGIPSAAASAGQLRVVGIELPPGASQKDGVVRLHRGQRARLIGAEGLELSYGGSAYFVAAPQTVGLPPRGGIAVRLRARGDHAEAMFRLDPIEISAEVSISPGLARWPDDTIRVRVTPRGTAVSELEPIVTVNARAVRVSWKVDGSSLRAVVPRASGAGPWVIRVEVRGPRGRIVGRDFLEVVQAPAVSTRNH